MLLLQLVSLADGNSSSGSCWTPRPPPPGGLLIPRVISASPAIATGFLGFPSPSSAPRIWGRERRVAVDVEGWTRREVGFPRRAVAAVPAGAFGSSAAFCEGRRALLLLLIAIRVKPINSGMI